MARISGLVCPIDGLALDARTITLSQREDAEQRSRIAVGSHAHISLTGDFSCSNGHVWRFDEGEQTLTIYRRQ